MGREASWEVRREYLLDKIFSQGSNIENARVASNLVR